MSGSSLLASLGAALHTFSSPLFSFKASTPIPSKENSAIAAFEDDLSTQLDELHATSFLDATGSLRCLRMSWLCNAMNLVLSTHASAEAFLPELLHAISYGDTKWLDSYLDDSVKLLDTCNAMREAIKEIRSYHMKVELALSALKTVENINEAQLRRVRNALDGCILAMRKKDQEAIQLGHRRSKLETCGSMLRRMGEKLHMEGSSKGSFFKVCHAAQLITIFICGVLVSTLSFKPRRPLSIISVDGQSAWASSLTSLQHALKDQLERKTAKGVHILLQELHDTNMAIESLHGKVMLLKARAFPVKGRRLSGLRRRVGCLQDCSTELRNGLDLLHKHVEDVFRILMTSRMELLDIYGGHNHHVTSSFKRLP